MAGEVQARLLERAGAGTPAVAVWRPGRQLRFGYRDTRQHGYREARTWAREAGFDPVERRVGGRAVATTETTALFAVAEPVDADGARSGIGERYDRAVTAVRRALSDLGVDADRGEPAAAYCPGDHSLRADGKLAGLAQRVTASGALVSGVCYVADRGELADALAAVYDRLGYQFDRSTVGTVAAAGGDDRFERVAGALADRLVRVPDTTDESVEVLRPEQM